jgi:hypothetical protein
MAAKSYSHLRDIRVKALKGCNGALSRGVTVLHGVTAIAGNCKLSAAWSCSVSSLPVRITRNVETNDVMRLSLFSGGFHAQVTVHLFRALLLAAQPVPSFLARLRAIGTFPTPGADATSGRGVTRTIVHAFAVRVTIHAVKTLRALCFASDSCFDVKKQNPSRESVLQ